MADKLQAVRRNGLYTILKNGVFWFAHYHPDTFRGMILGRLKRDQIAAIEIIEDVSPDGVDHTQDLAVA